jgi:putative transcriptional regulator
MDSGDNVILLQVMAGEPMISSSCKRLGLLVAAILLPAVLLHSAYPAPAQGPKRLALAGELLIASPAMTDPRFYQAVVLIVRHDRNGALGIIINRPLEDRSLASLLEALGDKDTTVEGRVRIFAGGPVQPEIGFVLHSAEYHATGTTDIDGHVAVTSSPEILRDIANKRGPMKTLIAFGYAGWGPSQLDGELEHRFWFIAPEDSRFVFDHDRDMLWDEAMKRRTQDL